MTMGTAIFIYLLISLVTEITERTRVGMIKMTVNLHNPLCEPIEVRKYPLLDAAAYLDDTQHTEVNIDGRFRQLLGQKGWSQLHPAIQKRFGKHLKLGESAVYQGIVTRIHLSKFGSILAQVARIIGGPLPYDRKSIGQPAILIVTEDIATSGQFWIRQYGRKGKFPQTIHSSKRFAGPTGLEEYIGYAIGIALNTEATPKALFFKSDHYFLQLAGARLKLPSWLSPGAMTIGHHEQGNGRFRFTLSLTNRYFGTLIHQEADFNDAKE